MSDHSNDELTAAEERRAAEEALIAERNAAQRQAEADGSTERVLLTDLRALEQEASQEREP
jgi:hypothetical protein